MEVRTARQILHALDHGHAVVLIVVVDEHASVDHLEHDAARPVGELVLGRDVPCHIHGLVRAQVEVAVAPILAQLFDAGVHEARVHREELDHVLLAEQVVVSQVADVALPDVLQVLISEQSGAVVLRALVCGQHVDVHASMGSGPSAWIVLSRVGSQHVRRHVRQAARGEVEVDGDRLPHGHLVIPNGLDEVEGSLPVERELRDVEAVVGGADQRGGFLEADELDERWGQVRRVVQHLDLLRRLLHLDHIIRVVIEMPAPVDVLVPDVPSDPLVVEADVGRLGSRIAVRVEQAELDVVGVLARLAVPDLEVVVIVAGQPSLP